MHPKQTTECAKGPIYRMLADDHARLDQLLQTAVADVAHVDERVYTEFRRGLLRHISMEEKVLLPAAQRARGGEPLESAARLRLDHGAIVALLVPRPTAPIIAALRHILANHNRIEEGPDGVYETCERVVGADRDAVVAALRATPDVPVHALAEPDAVMHATRRALERAGYADLL